MTLSYFVILEQAPWYLVQLTFCPISVQMFLIWFFAKGQIGITATTASLPPAMPPGFLCPASRRQSQRINNCLLLIYTALHVHFRATKCRNHVSYIQTFLLEPNNREPRRLILLLMDNPRQKFRWTAAWIFLVARYQNQKYGTPAADSTWTHSAGSIHIHSCDVCRVWMHFGQWECPSRVSFAQFSSTEWNWIDFNRQMLLTLTHMFQMPWVRHIFQKSIGESITWNPARKWSLHAVQRWNDLLWGRATKGRGRKGGSDQSGLHAKRRTQKLSCRTGHKNIVSVSFLNFSLITNCMLVGGNYIWPGFRF